MRRARVYVSIVNYNSASLLRECLESLRCVDVDGIWVVDNGSRPGEVDELQEAIAAAPNAHLVSLDTNLGFGAGQNRAIEAIPGRDEDLVWILNPDTRVSANALEALRGAIDGDAADVVSPAILTTRAGKPRLWFSGGPIDRSRGFVVESQLGRDVRALDGAAELLETEFISGAAPMMRLGTWRSFGGFDEGLFLYWEDVDLCLRMAAAGLRLRVSTRGRIFHHEGGSSRGESRARPRSYYFTSRNRILVCRRPGTRGWGLIVGLGGPRFIRLIAYAVVHEPTARARNVVAVVRGAVSGLKQRSIEPAGRPGAGGSWC